MCLKVLYFQPFSHRTTPSSGRGVFEATVEPGKSTTQLPDFRFMVPQSCLQGPPGQNEGFSYQPVLLRAEVIWERRRKGTPGPLEVLNELCQPEAEGPLFGDQHGEYLADPHAESLTVDAASLY